MAVETAKWRSDEEFKLVGFKQFVRHNPRSDRFPVLGFHHVEFWTADATSAAGRFSFGLGMLPAARSDLTTGNSLHASYLIRSGSLQFLFSSPYSPFTPAAAGAAPARLTPRSLPSIPTPLAASSPPTAPAPPSPQLTSALASPSPRWSSTATSSSATPPSPIQIPPKTPPRSHPSSRDSKMWRKPGLARWIMASSGWTTRWETCRSWPRWCRTWPSSRVSTSSLSSRRRTLGRWRAS